jgi:hypothetical protein
MLLFHELGRRLGVRRRARDLEGSRLGLGPVESATFGLLGLLIAFTFSGAASRFDARRHLVVEEANLIEQAWLRVDLLPQAEQPAIRTHFRDYLDARLAVYDKLPDLGAARAELERSRSLQREIWKGAVTVSRNGGSFGVNLLLASINGMIDIATERTMATRMHPPGIVYGMLFSAALMAALLAGYNSAGGTTRGWLHAIGLASVVSIALYVIIDIEHPRVGLVRVDKVDEVLRELRHTMN